MIDDIKPRQNMDKKIGISRVPSSHALHVGGDGGGSVEGGTGLGFADHFLHIHVDFSRVFGESVEPVWNLVSTHHITKPQPYWKEDVLQDR